MFLVKTDKINFRLPVNEIWKFFFQFSIISPKYRKKLGNQLINYSRIYLSACRRKNSSSYRDIFSISKILPFAITRHTACEENLKNCISGRLIVKSTFENQACVELGDI